MSVEINRGLMTVIARPPELGKDYLKHKRRWRGCRRCTLYEKGKSKVFYRGDIPCEVLFVGEAPGFDEHETGFPFVGRAGGLLQSAIDQVQQEDESGGTQEFTYGITNAVLCFPDHETGFRKPHTKEVRACTERLSEFLDIARPSAILLMGATAGGFLVHGVTRQWREKHDGCLVMTTPHPAWILRRGGVGTADYQRLVLHIRQVVEAARGKE